MSNILNLNSRKTQSICVDGIEDEFTEESISAFFGALKNNSDNGSFDHIPDAGKKVAPKDNNHE